MLYASVFQAFMFHLRSISVNSPKGGFLGIAVGSISFINGVYIDNTCNVLALSISTSISAFVFIYNHNNENVWRGFDFVWMSPDIEIVPCCLTYYKPAPKIFKIQPKVVTIMPSKPRSRVWSPCLVLVFILFFRSYLRFIGFTFHVRRPLDL